MTYEREEILYLESLRDKHCNLPNKHPTSFPKFDQCMMLIRDCKVTQNKLLI